MTDPRAPRASAPQKAPPAAPSEAMIVDVDGFEGPLDLLLTLAQRQKVDLRRISVLALAEQFLAVIDAARARAQAVRLDLAADWLVMAAWLAWLKSRLLLPPEPGAEGPSAEDLALHLARQLERLEAMRAAVQRLLARDRLGRERFARGALDSAPDSSADTGPDTGPDLGPQNPAQAHRSTPVQPLASLHDLLTAYARLRTRDAFRPLAFDRVDVFALDAALARLARLIGLTLDWTDLAAFLPPDWQGPGGRRRSATASTFCAALELVRAGRAEMRQDAAFGALALRPGPSGG